MHKFLICVLIGFFLYLTPKPETLTPEAWQLFAIFTATIIGIILRPFPMGAVALMGLCTTIFTKTLNIQTEALTGFSSHVIWLIIMVFFIARGVVKTKLGVRVAYYFVSIFGKKTLSLGYALSFTEVFLAPFIPSNTARAGGIMFPIIKSISEALGSSPEDGTEQKVGSFLTQIGYHTNVVSSSLFLTGCAVNPVAQAFAAQHGIEITWTSWFIAALAPGIVSLITMPMVIYWINPPKEKNISFAVSLAKDKLLELGPVSKAEKYMMTIFGFMLTLWILEPFIKINSTTVAFMGICLCLLSNILTIDDILAEKEAWNTFLWLSTLVTMSSYLQKFGFIDWASAHLGTLVMGFSPMVVLLILTFVYFYMHYFFAGNMAQVSAVYPAFLSVCLMAGAPAMLSALILGFFSSIFSCLTHYGTASAPIYFASGYTPLKTWWKIGGILSLVYMVIWYGIGGIWWKVLGLY